MSTDPATLADTAAIVNFYRATLDKNIVERGQVLGRDTNIHKAHNVVASQGQTEVREKHQIRNKNSILMT